MTLAPRLLAMLVVVGCRQDPPAPSLPPIPVAPTEGATGDADVRVLVTELMSAQACDRLRGGFHGLRSPDHPGAVSGVLWIRECEISSSGAKDQAACRR